MRPVRCLQNFYQDSFGLHLFEEDLSLKLKNLPENIIAGKVPLV